MSAEELKAATLADVADITDDTVAPTKGSPAIAAHTPEYDEDGFEIEEEVLSPKVQKDREAMLKEENDSPRMLELKDHVDQLRNDINRVWTATLAGAPARLGEIRGMCDKLEADGVELKKLGANTRAGNISKSVKALRVLAADIPFCLQITSLEDAWKRYRKESGDPAILEKACAEYESAAKNLTDSNLQEGAPAFVNLVRDLWKRLSRATADGAEPVKVEYAKAYGLLADAIIDSMAEKFKSTFKSPVGDRDTAFEANMKSAEELRSTTGRLLFDWLNNTMAAGKVKAALVSGIRNEADAKAAFEKLREIKTAMDSGNKRLPELVVLQASEIRESVDSFTKAYVAWEEQLWTRETARIQTLPDSAKIMQVLMSGTSAGAAPITNPEIREALAAIRKEADAMGVFLCSVNDEAGARLVAPQLRESMGRAGSLMGKLNSLVAALAPAEQRQISAEVAAIQSGMQAIEQREAERIKKLPNAEQVWAAITGQPPRATVSTPATAAAMKAWLQDAKQLCGDFEVAYGSIQDEATARSALPKLQALTGRFQKAKALLDQMPIEDCQQADGEINAIQARLQGMQKQEMERIQKLPEAAAIRKLFQ